MGWMDKIKGALGQHSDKVETGVDKAGNTIDDRTGNKYVDKVDQGQDAANEALPNLDDGGDTPR